MARVKLNGYVLNDMAGRIYAHYGFSVIYPDMIRQAIADNPEGEDLTFEINSGGGQVFDGFECYSVIKGASCKTVAEVQSLAGSAASTIALACDHVAMSPVAQIMIHNPAKSTDGDIVAHQRGVQMLDAIKESILNGYQLRCGSKCTRKKLCDLMSAETWLPAQQAVELGLADEILYQGDANDPSLFINSAQGGMRALAGAGALPDFSTLKARYDAEHPPADPHGKDDPQSDAAHSDPAGATPANSKDDWAARAALEIEKNRYI